MMEGRGANTKPANFKRDDLVARKVRAAGSPVTKDGLRFRKQVKHGGNKQTTMFCFMSALSKPCGTNNIEAFSTNCS